MNTVGIDVSKGNSMVAVMRPLGEMVTMPYSVNHDKKELSKLVWSLKKLEGETRIIMEYTGRYYEPVANILHNAGLFVSVVNPLLIKEYGNNSVRKVKTDKADAMKIAKYGLDNWSELVEYNPSITIRQDLQILCRQYNHYMKNKVAYKNNLISLIDQAFPHANSMFTSPVRSDGKQKWVDFISTFWHCECVSKISEKQFLERYHRWCKRNGYNFSSKKASTIYVHSKEQFPVLAKSSRTKLLISEAVNQLNSISKTIENLRAEMHILAETLPEYPIVVEMYGVGKTIAAQLIAEIGDVRRFKNKQSLCAFAGVDPSPNQSGKHNSKSNRITKRGCASLRKTLFQVADCIIQKSPKDDPLFLFLNKKRSEGKPYYVYMTAGANKFLRLYYGRVKEFMNNNEIPTYL